MRIDKKEIAWGLVLLIVYLVAFALRIVRIVVEEVVCWIVGGLIRAVCRFARLIDKISGLFVYP